MPTADRVEAVDRVLVVDDDPSMCEMLTDLLESSGLAADAVTDGAAMNRALLAEAYSLLLVDLRLKREDGLALARSVRETSDIPIVILTGKGDDTDRILGLELVADDYLTKPFNPRELIARVRAVLRRAKRPVLRPERATPQTGAPASHKAFHFGGYVLYFESRVLLGPNREPCKLTANEFELLATMVQNANRVLTRDELLERMRRQDSDVFDRAIDVLVLRLRRKIEINPSAPRYIRTERGFGYVFSVPDDDASRR